MATALTISRPVKENSAVNVHEVYPTNVNFSNADQKTQDEYEMYGVGKVSKSDGNTRTSLNVNFIKKLLINNEKFNSKKNSKVSKSSMNHQQWPVISHQQKIPIEPKIVPISLSQVKLNPLESSVTHVPIHKSNSDEYVSSEGNKLTTSQKYKKNSRNVQPIKSMNDRLLRPVRPPHPIDSVEKMMMSISLCQVESTQKKPPKHASSPTLNADDPVSSESDKSLASRIHKKNSKVSKSMNDRLLRPVRPPYPIDSVGKMMLSISSGQMEAKQNKTLEHAPIPTLNADNHITLKGDCHLMMTQRQSHNHIANRLDKISNILSEKQPLSPKVSKKTCSCCRDLKRVMCKICGHSVTGRIRLHCNEHPVDLYFLDISECPNPKCRSPSNLKEYEFPKGSYPKDTSNRKIDTNNK